MRSNLPVNLHVMPRNNPEIELNLKFRDFLRDNAPEMRKYAELKRQIIRAQDAHEKHHPTFNNYTLRKSSFIKEVLHKAGFNRTRLMFATTEEEWQQVKFMRDEYLAKQHFDNYARTIPINQSHKHFILYKGINIAGYMHVQLLPNHQANRQMLAINEEYARHSFDKGLIIEELIIEVKRWLNLMAIKLHNL